MTFQAHERSTTQLRIRHVDGGWRKLTLDPSHTHNLQAAPYLIQIEDDAGEWREAGRLVIEPGARSYEVRMLAAPPWFEVEAHW